MEIFDMYVVYNYLFLYFSIVCKGEKYFNIKCEFISVVVNEYGV